MTYIISWCYFVVYGEITKVLPGVIVAGIL